MKKGLKIFLILLTGFLIICGILGYELFKGAPIYLTINSIKDGFIYREASNSNNLVSCDKLNDNDVKILNNSFKGTEINGDIDYWCKLQVIEIFDNKNTIQLPKEIGKLNNLHNLTISGTKIYGGIPKEIGNLKNLMIIELSNNNLGGTFPSEITKLENLEILNINGNKLSGTLPKDIGILSKLSTLVITYNYIDGEIPESIGNLKNLRILELHHNKLSGKIPTTLKKLDKLVILILNNNNFDNKNLKSNLMEDNKLEDILK